MWYIVLKDNHLISILEVSEEEHVFCFFFTEDFKENGMENQLDNDQ